MDKHKSRREQKRQEKIDRLNQYVTEVQKQAGRKRKDKIKEQEKTKEQDNDAIYDAER